MFADLKRSPREVLEALPNAPATDDYRDDVRWLLNRVEAERAVRIRCGGEEFTDPAGRVWGKDRFFLGGRPATPWMGGIEGTDADALYDSERWFGASDADGFSGYRIPLPPGGYRVRLHFSEVDWPTVGARRFDAVVAGTPVATDLDIVREAGFATALVKEAEVDLGKGPIEIRFELRSVLATPMVSAIEILKLD